MDDADTVFFYNVKTGMFLCEGNDYGTRSSVSSTGTAFAIIKNLDTKGVWNGTLTLWNHTKTSNGQYKYPLWNKMFVDAIDVSTGGAAYLDAAASKKRTNFVIYSMGNKVYQISADTIAGSDTDPKTIGPTRFGWSGTENSTIISPTLNTDAENAANFGLDWKIIKGDTVWMKKYSLRSTLCTLINRGVDDNVTVSAYSTVYNDAEATEEELKTAIAGITEDLRKADIAKATDTNPVDVTSYYITNADCKSLDGWKASAVSVDWKTQSTAHSNADKSITIQDFIERWINSGSSLANGRIYQKLTGLPSGVYKLTADVVAVQQSDVTKTNTGTWLFAKTAVNIGDSVECATIGDGIPIEVSLNATVTNGELTIGYETINTTCNWIGMDNYKLQYFGNGTGLLRTDLKASAESAKSYAESAMANAVVLSTLDDAITAANETANNPDATVDELNSASSKLAVALKAAKDNVAAYTSLSAKNTEAVTFITGHSETNYPKVADLKTYINDVDGQGTPMSDILDGYQFGTEEVNTAIATLTDLIKKANYSGIIAGKDVTYALADPAFDNNGQGWTNKQTVNATYKNCEAYQKTFDQYQILTDLPNGKYTIKVQAFQRPGSNADAYNNYVAGKDNVTTYVYANEKQQKVKDVNADAQTTSPNADITDWQADYKNAAGTYTPNSMWGSSRYFDLNLYDNTVSALVSDGVLRLGIKCVSSSSSYWTIFDNFRMVYDGNSIEVLKTLVDEAKVTMDGIKAKPMCKDSLNAMTAAYEKANAETNSENLVQEIVAFNKAINAANNSIATYATLTTALDWANTTANDNVKSDEAKQKFATKYEDVSSKCGAGDYADADIPSAIKTVKAAVTSYLIYDDAKVATATSPKDVSYVIVNPQFAANTRNSWTFTKTAGNDNVAYHCFEVWNGNFKISQDVYGLPKGTYKLVARGFYRDGDNAGMADSVAKGKLGLNAKIFVNDKIADVKSISDGARDTTGMNTGSNSVYVFDSANKLYTPNNMQNAEAFFKAEGGDKYDSSVDFTLSEEGEVTLGAKKEYLVANDWTILKGFTLMYYGVTKTSGINAAENNEAEVVNRRFYNANGIETGRLQSGLNIIKSTLKDGTVKVQKVVVK